MTLKPARRTLEYEGFHQIAEDVTRLRSGSYQRCGQWSLTQNCEHLTLVLKGSMEHLDDPPLGWLIRPTVGKLVMRQILKTRKLRSGFDANGDVKPRNDGKDDDPVVLDRFLEVVAAVSKCQKFARHPFFGDITAEEWKAFHLIHCAHHLSHLVPA